MAGRVVRILPKTFVSFTPNQGVAITSPTTMTQILARRVDVSQWREITLFARFHTPTLIGGLGAGLPKIVAWSDGYTDEDPTPAVDKNGTFGLPSGLFMTSIALSNNQVNPQTSNTVQTLTIAFPSNVGGMIMVGVTAIQNNPVQQCDMYMSIDLCGKDGAP